MKKLLFVALLFAYLNGFADDISKIVVHDYKQKLDTELVKSDELAKFKVIWDAKQETEVRAKPQWTHVIDITPGESWWYSSNGITMSMAWPQTTFYRISNVADFNKLLKIKNSAEAK